MPSSRNLLPAFAASAFALLVAQGCSNSNPPAPRVALFSKVGTSTAHPQTDCKLGPPTDWVDIGLVGDNNVPGNNTQPVNDGAPNSTVAASFNGRTVHITACSVVPAGSAFAVNVAATLDGVGSFTVNGTVDKNGGQNIQGVFERGDTGAFTENDCTVSYPRPAYPDNTPEMGIAAGRIWAQLDCPNAELASQGRTCGATAEFRFENCAQQ